MLLSNASDTVEARVGESKLFFFLVKTGVQVVALKILGVGVVKKFFRL